MFLTNKNHASALDRRGVIGYKGILRGDQPHCAKSPDSAKSRGFLLIDKILACALGCVNCICTLWGNQEGVPACNLGMTGPEAIIITGVSAGVRLPHDTSYRPRDQK